MTGSTAWGTQAHYCSASCIYVINLDVLIAFGDLHLVVVMVEEDVRCMTRSSG
jgi:hypothetical protein